MLKNKSRYVKTTNQVVKNRDIDFRRKSIRLTPHTFVNSSQESNGNVRLDIESQRRLFSSSLLFIESTFLETDETRWWWILCFSHLDENAWEPVLWTSFIIVTSHTCSSWWELDEKAGFAHVYAIFMATLVDLMVCYQIIYEILSKKIDSKFIRGICMK